MSALGWHVCHDGSLVWLQTLEAMGGVEALTPPEGRFFYAESSEKFLAATWKVMRILNSACWVCEWVFEYEEFVRLSNIQIVHASGSAQPVDDSKPGLSDALRAKLRASTALAQRINKKLEEG